MSTAEVILSVVAAIQAVLLFMMYVNATGWNDYWRLERQITEARGLVVDSCRDRASRRELEELRTTLNEVLKHDVSKRWAVYTDRKGQHHLQLNTAVRPCAVAAEE